MQPPRLSPASLAARIRWDISSRATGSGQRVGCASTMARVRPGAGTADTRLPTCETQATVLSSGKAWARYASATAPPMTRQSVSRPLVRPPPR